MTTTEEQLRARVAQLEAKLHELEKAVQNDALTGLLNRAGAELSLTIYTRETGHQLAHPDRRHFFIIRAFSLLLIDIDHFKNINDTYGHPAGDMVLGELAKCLRANLRAVDIVGRWGGEEFIIGLLGADAIAAQLVAEKLRQAVEALELQWESKAVNITISIGVAQLNPSMSLDQLVAVADKALYAAKAAGRNRVEAADV